MYATVPSALPDVLRYNLPWAAKPGSPSPKREKRAAGGGGRARLVRLQ